MDCGQWHQLLSEDIPALSDKPAILGRAGASNARRVSPEAPRLSFRRGAGASAWQWQPYSGWLHAQS